MTTAEPPSAFREGDHVTVWWGEAPDWGDFGEGRVYYITETSLYFRPDVREIGDVDFPFTYLAEGWYFEPDRPGRRARIVHTVPVGKKEGG